MFTVYCSDTVGWPTVSTSSVKNLLLYFSNLLHESETWPVRKENEVALQRAEMRMVRWMCSVKVKDLSSK